MPTNFLDMISQAANSGVDIHDPTQEKKAKLSATAEIKRATLPSVTPPNFYSVAAGRGNDRGAATMTETEADLRTMNPTELYSKYGSAAADLISQAAQGGRDYQKDTGMGRTPDEAARDVIQGVGQGFFNSVAGIGALGVGLVNKDAGARISKGIADFNEDIKSGQSPSLTGAQRASAARRGLETRDNDAQRQIDIKNDGEFIAGAKQIGREAVQSVMDTVQDPTLLTQGSSEAVGSLLVGGPIGKGIKAIGAGILAGAGSKLSTSAAIKAAAAVEAASMPIAIGAMEAGGAYQGSTSEVLNMDFKQLKEVSPLFNELTAKGMSEEEARNEVANRTGLLSAAIAGPVGAGAGVLVSKFEANPLKVHSLGSIAGNLSRETVEEGIQGASGQFGQNLATKTYADKTQRLTEGVGEGIGQGALFGLAAAGIAQGPGAAVAASVQAGATSIKAAQGLYDKTVGAVMRRGERIQAENETASPVSPDVIMTAGDEIIATAAVDQPIVDAGIAASSGTDEQKTEARAYVDQVLDTLSLREDELNQEGLDESTKAILQGSSNRVAAIAKLADAVENGPDNLITKQVLYNQIQEISDILQADPEALRNIPEDHQAQKIIGAYIGLYAQTQNMPNVKKAMRALQEQAQAGQFVDETSVTAENIDTPEGKSLVNNVLMNAELGDLSKGNLPSTEHILYQDAQGALKLTDAQRNALKASVAVMRVAQEAVARADALGLGQAQDIVSKEILTGTEGQRKKGDQPNKSALEYAKAVYAAKTAGDDEGASAILSDFGLFVQHMQNKVEAINRHFTDGDPNAGGVTYSALMPDAQRSWKPSPKGLFVRPNNVKSVRTAQQIAFEAETLFKLFTGLREAFDGLAVGHVEPVYLNPQLLSGTAEEVATKFAASTKSPEQDKVPVAVEKPTDTPIDKNVNKKEKADVQDAPKNEAQPEPVQEAVEAKPEPEQVVTEKPTPEAEPEVKPASEERTVKLVGIDAVFPDLVEGKGKVKNWFKQSFKLPAEASTNTISVESPMDFIQGVLATPESLAQFLGSKAVNDVNTAISKAYADRLALGGELGAILQDNLQAFLKGNNVLKRFLNGEDVERWREGKLLSITERDGETLGYNRQLYENAILAGLQWQLEASQFGATLDQEGLGKILGIDPNQVDGPMLQSINQGMTKEEAVQSLATKIERYWGMEKNSDTVKGQSDGIAMVMAAELIRAMTEVKIIEEVETTFTKEQHGITKPKQTFIKYKVNPGNLEDPIFQAPTLIEQAVMIVPEDTMYLGDNMPPVATRQMNNGSVPLTKQQIDAITKEQKQPHTINPVMAAFYVSLGIDNLKDIFGGGDLTNRKLNKNFRLSLEGKNRSIEASFEQIMRLTARVGNQAAKAGMKITDYPVRYAYNMSSVGRMQMLGKNNPQADKLVREMVLPTKAVLDLSNQNDKHYAAFTLGLGQALGVKVHTMSRAASAAKVETMLNGPLAPAVSMVQDWLLDQSRAFTAEEVQILKDSFKAAGAPLSAVGLHAVTEFARYRSTPAKSLGAFSTQLYVEADGVTNGVMNAMVMMTAGRFTRAFIENIAKGGASFGPAKTLSDLRSVDGKDLYETTTDSLSTNISTLRAVLNQSEDKTGVQQLNRLLSVMDTLLEDVSFELVDELDGTTTLKRGVAKNPLTITVYGSGAAGIAGKVTGELLAALYEKVSLAGEAMSLDSNVSMAEAFFPNAADPQAKFDEFRTGLGGLINLAPDSKLNFKPSGAVAQGKFEDIEEFTITNDAVKALEKNVLELFVVPMRAAITQTIGQDLVDSTTNIRRATQAQSIILQYAFQKKVEEAVAEKAKDPEWRKADFLSENELRDILKSLAPLAPMIETGDQSFYVAGSQKTDIKVSEIASALDGSLRMNPGVAGPMNAGVRGIPMLTIGMGDGKMMQLLAALSLEGTLKIFDGMHMPLDKIEEYSRLANQAVFDSWMANPVQNVSDTFNEFMKNVTIDEDNAELNQALKEALFIPTEWKKKATAEELMDAMKFLQVELQEQAREVTARHEVMAEVAMSVDQMAAAGAPHVNGGVLLSDDPDVQLQELNIRLEDKLNGVATDIPVAVPAVTAPEIERVGRAHSTGVRELSFTAVKNLGRLAKMTNAQRVMFGELIRSKAIKDYKVVFGTAEQIRDYQIQKGGLVVNNDTRSDVSGYTLVAERTIYLVNPSTETLVHELIHAGSFEAVLNHYQGEDMGAPISEAITRMEAQMEEFLGMGLTDKAYLDAKAAIEGAQTEFGSSEAVSKAKALNEFMAWALSNESLTTALETKSNPLLQLAKDVVKWIKQLVWGRKKAPTVGDSFLTNLQFNAGVVIRSQPSVAQMFNETVLFQSSVYGNNDRLVRINDAFSKKISDLLGSAREVILNGGVAPDTQKSEAEFKANNLFRSAARNGFPMRNAQEATTFKVILAALMTEAQIDPNSLSRFQDLYAHVTKNLSVESFMADPTDDAQRYYAQQKYDMVVGKKRVETDVQGRSSLLPVFIALATTNEEFRSILKKMPVPKTARVSGATFDAYLENAGNWMMDTLSNRMSGQNKATNIRQAVDNLTDQIAEVAQDRLHYMEAASDKASGFVDKGNRIITNGFEKFSDFAMQKAEDLEATAKGKTAKSFAASMKLLAAVVSEKNGTLVAEGVVTMMNKVGKTGALYDVIIDLVGRTSTNAEVFDLIKRVRAFVQQSRQQFREHLPEVIEKKFSRKLTDAEWNSMTVAMGKSDLAALRQSFSIKDILQFLDGKNAINAAIKGLQSDIQEEVGQDWNTYERKMRQLAKFLNTGEVGNNLLRNAHAIGDLFGETKSSKWKAPSAATVKAIDQLVSLYAFDTISQEHKDAVASLVQDEAEGMAFVLNYLVGQRTDEQTKAMMGDASRINHYKGYIPTQQQPGASLIVADDNEFASLRERSFVRVADYEGSSADRLSIKRGYYYAPVSGRAAFQQGIMQNVRQTASGVDQATGFTEGRPTAGRITDLKAIGFIQRRTGQEKGREPLMPIYDKNGAVVAYERSVDPVQFERIAAPSHLAKMIGQWRGRQVEETQSQDMNRALISALKKVYDTDMKDSGGNKDQYVDLFDTKFLKANPVVADAVKLFTPDTLAMIKAEFGKNFFVRKDMLNDSIGYRSASVGDMWSGNTNWSPEVQNTVRKLALGIFGNDAYKHVMSAERLLQNFVGDAKTLIVIKSVIVPFSNMMANMYQLIARGVPLTSIIRDMPRKTAEVDTYVKSQLKKIELEAELRAAEGIDPQNKLKVQIKTIEDSHKRLSIWPLIEAGEFSSISDVGMTHEEVELTSGRLGSYIESLVMKLPKEIRNAGRYGLITKDTALFQGLQKAVQYGDFLAKAVLYDDLTKRQKKTKEYTLGKITEEFVNYDRLSGRTRGALEGMGLLWFYNFKIRSAKIAVSMIRNNPLHSLIAMVAPVPELFGTVGLPIEDNIFAKAADGSIQYSLGMGQGFRAPFLNPFVNLVN